MTKISINIIIILFTSCKLIAQKNDNLALQSLEYLNQRFHLNLDKENTEVLITIGNSEEYICYKYFKSTNLPKLSKIKWKYNIETIGDSKYGFTLKGSSELKGTFEVMELGKDYNITNLEFVKRND